MSYTCGFRLHAEGCAAAAMREPQSRSRCSMIRWRERSSPKLAAIGVMLVCQPAAAQGNGHGNAYGHYKSTIAASTHVGSNGTPIPGTGVVNSMV